MYSDVVVSIAVMVSFSFSQSMCDNHPVESYSVATVWSRLNFRLYVYIIADADFLTVQEIHTNTANTCKSNSLNYTSFKS